MKKLILSLAVAAMALLPAAGFSQVITSTTVAEAGFVDLDSVAPAQSKMMKKGAKKGAKAYKGKKGSKGQKFAKGQRAGKANCQFAGLNLTDAQKAQLDTLNCQFANQCREYKECIADGCGDSCRGLSKAARRAEAREYKDGLKDLSAQYLASIQQILTPEQYTKFLENNYKYRMLSKSKRFHPAKFYKDANTAYSRNVGYPTVFVGQDLDNIAEINKDLKQMKSKK